MYRRTVAFIALSLAFSSTVFGADFMPLTPGMRWEYRSTRGAHQVETITGYTTVRGRVVATRSYSDGPDAGLQNYWYFDSDGSLMIAGFTNPASGLAWAYDPPVRYVPMPPVVAPQPMQTITARDLLTDAEVFQFQIRLEVLENVTLSVPAGSFTTVGVGQVVMLPGPSTMPKVALTLDGRSLGAVAPGIYAATPTNWFAEGVGEVQYLASDLFQLVGFGLPTPVAQSSWARVKRLYR